ncbi:MAG: DUF4124 domain-containing protein [Marinicella sp.]|nr:DUF4124 domain-containing protein [Xanthomonadales bacterium]
MKYFAILLMFLGVAVSIHAEKIYKWVDENGQIHYSSQKPPGQETETVKVSKGPKVTQNSSEKEDKETDAKAAGDDAAIKAQMAKTDAANMKRLCEQAKKNIAALNTTVRVTKVDEKTGETVRMTDDQRLEAMKNAQQGVKEYCK